MEKITENSLPALMTSSFDATKDWFKTFHELHSEMRVQVKKEQYSSISSNFGSIFTYELIKRKIDILDFKEVFKEMLNVFKDNEREGLYDRFFKPDNDIGLQEYLKNDRFNNSFSCWENMGHIFYNLETINKQKHRVFESSTFPYLKEMLINVDETNVLSVYGGDLHRVIYQMSANLSSLIPIIEIAQENPAYQIEKPGYNHNFLNTLLKDLGSHAYNSNHEETSEKIRILSEYVPNLKEVYSAALINDKDGANQAQNRLKIHLDVFKFLLDAGVDTCEIIHNKYLEKYNQVEFNKEEIKGSEAMKSYYRKAPYRDLIGEISSSLGVMLEKPLNFNLSIEHDSPAAKNYVMLKYLENNIKHNGSVILTNEDIVYLEKQSELEKNDKDTFSRPDIDFELITKYIQYQKLHETMPDKTTKTKAKKI